MDYKTPLTYGTLSKEELAAEIQKGLDDIEAGRTRTLDEVEADMKRKYERRMSNEGLVGKSVKVYMG